MASGGVTPGLCRLWLESWNSLLYMNSEAGTQEVATSVNNAPKLIKKIMLSGIMKILGHLQK